MQPKVCGRMWSRYDDQRGTVIVLISMVRFILAVIPICDFLMYDMITTICIIIFTLFQRFKTAF